MSETLTASSPVENRPVSFQPRRFKSTAEHYIKGRLNYPEDLIRRVILLSGLKSTDRVLDLGCGPGFLAVSFAPYAAETVGLDPEPDMLDAAEKYAAHHHARVTWRKGSSYDLAPDWGPFHLVTMGRSFHWMDRTATLLALDRIIPAGGAVALFTDRYLDVPENAWRKRYEAINEPLKKKFNLEDPSPWGMRHEGVLLESPFSYLQRITVVRRLETTTEQLISRALSKSLASPDRLGDQKDSYIDQVRQILLEEAPGGIVREIVETEALLAFRSVDEAFLAASA